MVRLAVGWDRDLDRLARQRTHRPTFSFDPDRARWMAPHAAHIIDSIDFQPSLKSAVATSSYVIGATARHRKW